MIVHARLLLVYTDDASAKLLWRCPSDLENLVILLCSHCVRLQQRSANVLLQLLLTQTEKMELSQPHNAIELPLVYF